MGFKKDSLNLTSAHLKIFPGENFNLKNSSFKIRAEKLWVRQIIANAKINPKVKKTNVIDTAQKPIRIPDIKIPPLNSPVTALVNIEEVVLENDSDLHIEIKHIQIKASKNSSPTIRFGKMYLNGKKYLDNLKLESQTAGNDLKFFLSAKNSKDSISVNGIVSDHNLEKLSFDLNGFLNNVKSYLPPPHYKKYPELRNMVISLEGKFGDEPNLEAKVNGNINMSLMSGFKSWAPSEHYFELDARAATENSELRLYSRGNRGETARLNVTGSGWNDIMRLVNHPENFKEMNWETKGIVNGFEIKLGDKIVPLNLASLKGGLNGNGFKGEVVTKHHTSLKGRINWFPDLYLDLQGQIGNREPWVMAWVDTNLSYDSLGLSITSSGKDFGILARMKNGKAYGALADSFTVKANLNSNGIYIKNGSLFDNSGVWEIDGNINWKECKGLCSDTNSRKKGVFLFAQHNQFGQFQFNMPEYRIVDIESQNLCLHKLPYKSIEKIETFSPALSGKFKWNLQDSSGNVDLNSQIQFNRKKVSMDVLGEWSSRNMDVKRLLLSHLEDSLQFKADLNKNLFFNGKELSIQDINSFTLFSKGIELSPWLALLKDSLIETMEIAGEMKFTPQAGFEGLITSKSLILSKAPPSLDLKGLSLKGTGDGFLLKGKLKSAETEWMNHDFEIRLGEALNYKKIIEADIKSPDSLTTSIRGNWTDKRLEAKLEIGGDIDFGANFGEVKNIHSLGEIVFDYSNPKQPLFEINNFRFEDLAYQNPDYPPLKLSGELSYGKNIISIPHLQISNANGQKAQGNGNFSMGNKMEAAFILKSPAFDFPLPGNHLVKTKNFRLDVSKGKERFAARLLFKDGSYQHKKGQLSLGTKLPKVFLNFEKIHGQKEFLSSYKLDGEIVVQDFGMEHETVSISGITNMFKRIGRKKVQKNLPNKKVLPVDLDVRLYTMGNNNILHTTFLNSSFEGDLQFTGILPNVYLTGEMNSIEGELYLANQSYNLNLMELSWFSEPVEAGAVELSAQVKLAEDCYARNTDSCYVELMTTGKLNDLEFVYSGSCGGDLGENLETLTLLKSVGMGCYNSDLSGEDASWAFATGILTDITSSWLRKNTGGWIDGCQVSGLQHLINSAEVSSDTATAAAAGNSFSDENLTATTGSCRTGEIVDGLRGSMGVRSLENSNEYELGIEWTPPLEKISNNSTWIHRVKNNILLDVKAKTVTDSENRVEVETETQLRLETGAQYRYHFWEIW